MSTSSVTRIAVCFLLAVAIAKTAAAATEKSDDKNSLVVLQAAQRIAGVPPEMLTRAHLDVDWPFSDLLVDDSDRVTQLFYHRGQLFVYSRNGLLFALDAENGNINWAKVLPYSGMDQPPVSYFENTLAILMGNTYVELRLADGEYTNQMELPFDVSTSVARNDVNLFAGDNKMRFYAVRLQDAVPMWRSVCKTSPTGRVAINDRFAYFTTVADRLVVTDIDTGRIAWEADITGRLCGLVLDRNELFIPSQNTSLYCLDSTSGERRWKVLCGGVLEELPTVMPDLVYQHVAQKSLLCLERQSGQLVWELPLGKTLLARNGDHSYVITLDNELTLMNNATGQRVVSFFLRNVTLHTTNLEDSRIFLASPQGDILTLRPLRPVEPTFKVREPTATESENTPDGQSDLDESVL